MDDLGLIAPISTTIWCASLEFTQRWSGGFKSWRLRTRVIVVGSIARHYRLAIDIIQPRRGPSPQHRIARDRCRLGPLAGKSIWPHLAVDLTAGCRDPTPPVTLGRKKSPMPSPSPRLEPVTFFFFFSPPNFCVIFVVFLIENFGFIYWIWCVLVSMIKYGVCLDMWWQTSKNPMKSEAFGWSPIGYQVCGR